MANPFEVRVPNVLEALLAGDKGYEAGSQFAQDRAMRSAAPMMAGGDYKNALATLLQGNNLRGALAVAGLGNNERDFELRRQEIARQQANLDRNYALQERNASNPNIQKTDSGEFVLLNKDGTGGRVIPVQGLGGPANPFATPGKPQTESESKTSLFADRAASAHEKITKFENLNEDLAGKIGAAAEKVLPAGVASMVSSAERQQLVAAKLAFINALLRRESGATIHPSEYSSYDREYFPQPGEGPEVIEQKRLHRAEVIRGLARGGGKNYQPGFSIDAAGRVSRSKPITKQEYDKLNSGDEFIAPDGSRRTKP